MFSLQVTTQFKKDLKLVKKKNLTIQKFEQVITLLLEEKELNQKYKDPQLSGKYIGFRECHIEPDWLLIYALNKGLPTYLWVNSNYLS
jgi:mRNA interferase YafQ